MARIVSVGLLILVFVATMTVSAQETTGDNIAVENYDAEIPVLLTDLQAIGILPSGLEESFVQGTTAFAGEGARFRTFDLENTAGNGFAGVALTFTPSGDALEFCGLGLRVQRTENNTVDGESTTTTIRLESYATVGINHEGIVFAFERGTDQAQEIFFAEDALDLSEPVYLQAKVFRDDLTVYANGREVLSSVPLSLDAGAFAVLYAGVNDNTRCAINSAFAYTFSDDLIDGCTISTDSPINQRSGPGTEFTRLSQLQIGQVISATGQTIGSDGFVWWYLDDGSWVREDVVDETGFCNALPEIDPDDV